jgi:hypothetical protein
MYDGRYRYFGNVWPAVVLTETITALDLSKLSRTPERSIASSPASGALLGTYVSCRQHIEVTGLARIGMERAKV